MFGQLRDSGSSRALVARILLIVSAAAAAAVAAAAPAAEVVVDPVGNSQATSNPLHPRS